MKRNRLKIVGESGAGLLSTGEIVLRALNEMGFYVVADRDYPSVIKGGESCFTINFSCEPIYGLGDEVDVMMAIERQSLEAYFETLQEGGVLVYGHERQLKLKDELEKAEARKIEVVHQMARTMALDQGGNVLMTNIVLVGMLWKVLGFDYKYVEDEVKRKFASKPKLLEIDLKCLKAGYDSVESKMEIEVPSSSGVASGDDAGGAKKIPGEKTGVGGAERGTGGRILMNGTHAVALGAIAAGCRAYYAYPMSPSSGILKYFADTAHETGILVKQVEDEISVVNMALGSMHMGTRALCATSGGGYDLMTETVSLSGMIETPLVVIIAQRPGPATGLPTWTCQGDLNLAIHSSHGEFTRMVIGLSGPEDSFELIQHAFNYAEKFQIPVIVLTEKQIVESEWTIEGLKADVPIERGLVEGAELEKLESADRYRITEDGISKRWIPGASEAYYFANGDEHLEDGVLTEDAEPSKRMIEKRIKKGLKLEAEMPEPVLYGEAAGADISFVGWGSSINVMKDMIAEFGKNGVKVNYLHYSYLWPFKTGEMKKFFEANKNVHLIENNYSGQLGNMIEAAGTGGANGAEGAVRFAGRLLKWNGRAFFTEEVREYINVNSG